MEFYFHQLQDQIGSISLWPILLALRDHGFQILSVFTEKFYNADFVLNCIDFIKKVRD